MVTSRLVRLFSLACYLLYSFSPFNANEIPNGDDANDLPLQDMQKDLNRSLKGLLHPLALFTPPYALHGDEQKLKVVDCDFDTYVKETNFSDKRTRMLRRKGARKFKKDGTVKDPKSF